MYLTKQQSLSFPSSIQQLAKEHHMSSVVRFIYILLIVTNSMHHVLTEEEIPKPYNYHYLPPVKKDVYRQIGDINIGDVVDVYRRWGGHKECRETFLERSDIAENSIPVKFAVDLVNRNPNLLPNVTLGFILHPACETISMKLATTLPFLPRSERICNGTECYIKQMMSESHDEYTRHDVIGMLAPPNSEEAAAVSSLLTVAHLPIIGFIAGSSELEFDAYHPFFFRVNAQDMYQIKAMLKSIASNDWRYIQMVYRDTDFGRDAYKFMHLYADSQKVCIAESHVVTDYDLTAKELLQNPRARVVVFFLDTRRWNILLRSIYNLNSSYHIIWIGSSLMDGYNGYLYKTLARDPGVGAFSVYPSAPLIPEYYNYVKNIDVHTTDNPWLKTLWEYLQSCSYSKETCKSNADILKTHLYSPYRYTSLKIDAVLAFAHAVHDLLQENCPEARGKEARACITGDLLREYLLKVKFQGYTGFIHFVRRRGVYGNFTIRQIEHGYTDDMFGPNDTKRIFETPVAIYQSISDKIIFLNNTISWSHLNPVERIAPRTIDSMFNDIPESVCSRPCIVGEYKIEKDLPCCWDCLRCRDNERLIGGNTGCEACPLLTWPDPMSDFTTCIDIPPTYQTMQDTIPIVLISVAVFAILLTIFIFSAYIKYRNERVVKASSRELSIIQLIGIVTGYTTVILFQTKPTHTMCTTIFFLFCMSFALLYCPLLVKTIRIVRIFKSAAKNQQPKFISPQSQLIVAIWLIVIQMLLSGTIFLLFIPGAQRTQPIWSEKMVELSCDLTLPGLASFLGYNIFLVCLCSVFAFMVRKLPDNYNESRFISMCVSTTLLIWMAFIPTYFTAGREYIRMFLLCMALILNHSVALTLLFLPKLYAAKFVKEGALNFAIKK